MVEKIIIILKMLSSWVIYHCSSGAGLQEGKLTHCFVLVAAQLSLWHCIALPWWCASNLESGWQKGCSSSPPVSGKVMDDPSLCTQSRVLTYCSTEWHLQAENVWQNFIRLIRTWLHSGGCKEYMWLWGGINFMWFGFFNEVLSLPNCGMSGR